MVDRECVTCGEIFDFKGGSLKCSDECIALAKVERARLYGLGRKWDTRLITAKRMTEEERRGRKWTEKTWENRFLNHLESELRKRDDPIEMLSYGVPSVLDDLVDELWGRFQ